MVRPSWRKVRGKRLAMETMGQEKTGDKKAESRGTNR